MLKTRIRKNTTYAARAIKLLAEIRTSVEALNDEDLLDLADIFAGTETTLKDIAAAEMQKRSLKP